MNFFTSLLAFGKKCGLPFFCVLILLAAVGVILFKFSPYFQEVFEGIVSHLMEMLEAKKELAQEEVLEKRATRHHMAQQTEVCKRLATLLESIATKKEGGASGPTGVPNAEPYMAVTLGDHKILLVSDAGVQPQKAESNKSAVVSGICSADMVDSLKKSVEMNLERKVDVKPAGRKSSKASPK